MNTILALTEENLLLNKIKGIINSDNREVITSTEDEIILTVYRYKVKCIIIDLDYYSNITLNTINDFSEIEYLPSIGVCSDINILDSKTKDSLKYIVEKKDINNSFINIINTFIDFKTSYDKVKECYEAVDVIDSEIDRLFKNQVYSAKELITTIFNSQSFIENKPSIFLFFSIKGEEVKADIYRINDKGIQWEQEALILDKGFLKDHMTINTEFYLNCDRNTYSDVDTYKTLLEGLFFGKGINIKNLAGYTTTDIAVFAINYNSPLTNYDAKVIKALCINLNLITNVHNKINDVNNAFKYTTEALARAGEAADDDTGVHIKRVNEYSKLIAELLGLDDEFIDILEYSAQMHDVGKIHVPATILKKPSALTSEEFQIIKDHTVLGKKIIGDADHLRMSADIALNHHEKYDGTGYPSGIAGENIPLCARIVALADVYDALRSPRTYKPSFSHEKTIDIIINGDGRVMPQHFDPSVLEVFKKYNKKFDEIYERNK